MIFQIHCPNKESIKLLQDISLPSPGCFPASTQRLPREHIRSFVGSDCTLYVCSYQQRHRRLKQKRQKLFKELNKLQNHTLGRSTGKLKSKGHWILKAAACSSRGRIMGSLRINFINSSATFPEEPCQHLCSPIHCLNLVYPVLSGQLHFVDTLTCCISPRSRFKMIFQMLQN